MDVLYTAHKQKNEDRLYLRWCTSMSSDSFEEYKKKAGWNEVFNYVRRFSDTKPENERTEEDILREVADILG